MEAALKATPGKYLRLYKFEKFSDGSGYRVKVDLASGPFRLKEREHFFEDLNLFCINLRKGYKYLKGEALLKYRYEEDYLKIEFTSLGHVLVSGLFREYSEKPQSLEFCFEVDQTYLDGFIKQMEIVNDAINS